MDLGIIGLGKMGANMAKRLLAGGHRVVGYDRSEEAVATLGDDGGEGVTDLEDLVKRLDTPRSVWLMIPAGDPVDATLDELVPLLDAGDTVLDGGNGNHKDALRRAASLAERGIDLVDVGVSGGVWGLEGGYSLMIGGDTEVVERHRPLFETLAPGPDKGWGHVGPCGAGHFVKTIHNGIEYGAMQAYAEGFAILKAKAEFDLDLHHITQIWSHGAVVRSWLLELIGLALEDDQDLSDIAPFVSDSGMGRWTVQEAIDLDVPAPVITHSLLARLRSRDDYSYADRLLAAMRQQFGGHAVKRED